MPRSGKASRARLVEAAVELFSERGFDAVTTAEIAERAGVTERTYFRHFPDKREVLFDGENQLAEWVTAALANVPLRIRPLAAQQQAFRAFAPKLERNREANAPLVRIVATTPALWERAAAKEARLVAMLAGLLRERGIDEEAADLAARIGWGTLASAMSSWQKDPASGLDEHINRAFRQLGILASSRHQSARS